MTDRERMLAILSGRPPDRIPWIPRLLLWYQARVLTHTIPEKWQGLSLREVERRLRVGTPARDGKIFELVLENVEVRESRSSPAGLNTRHSSSAPSPDVPGDGELITEYRTPKGTVRSVTRFSRTLEQVGLPGRVEEYLMKSPDDFRVWEYVMENARWNPCYGQYDDYCREIGDEGLPMVDAGDVPFHEFAQALAGYENAYFLLEDYPHEVEHLLGVMFEVQRERLWPVIFHSPARLILHGAHLSSQFTPPRLFDRYILPYYDQFIPLAHKHGKSVTMHADADVSVLLDRIQRAGWDMVECFVTHPMVPLTLERARQAWGGGVIIWGGLPSTLLSPAVSEQDFRSYMKEVFRIIAPGNAFILGAADNVMPDSLIERVEWVSDFAEEWGGYPLSCGKQAAV